MAGLRGRGFSTAKALQILFRIVADGSQARRETLKTTEEVRQAGREIRSIETLAQRVLSVLSRPIRGRFGFAGATGISLLREQFRGLADKEINKVKERFGETEQVIKSTSTSAITAAGSISLIGQALLKTRSKQAVLDIQGIAREYKDAAITIKAFEDVLARSAGRDLAKAKPFGPQVLTGDSLKAVLNRLGVTGNVAFGAKGFTFKNKDAEEGLAELQIGFNKIADAEERAAVAAKLFGDKVVIALPALEATRQKTLAIAEGSKKFEEASIKIATFEKATQAHVEATTAQRIKAEEATKLEEKAAKAKLIANEHLIASQARVDPNLGRRNLITGQFELTEEQIDIILKKYQKLTDSLAQAKVAQQAYDDIANKALKTSQQAGDRALKVRQDLAAAIEKETKAEQLATDAKNKLRRAQTELNKSLKFPVLRTEEERQEALGAFDKTTGKLKGFQKLTEEEKLAAGGFQTPEAIEKNKQKVKELREEYKLLSKDWKDAGTNLERLKDLEIETTSIADKAGIEADTRVRLAKERQKFTDAAQRKVDNSEVARAEKIRALNVEGTAAQAEELNAAAIATRTEANTLDNAVTATKVELLEAESAIMGELSVQYAFQAGEIELLSRALSKTAGGDVNSLVRTLKQLNTLKGVPGSGESGSPISPGAIGSMEGFIKKFTSYTTEAERAAFATETLGAEVATELLPAMESLVPATEAVVPALGGVTVALGPLGIAIGAAVLGGAALVTVLFLIAKHSADADAGMARLADRSGISAENISALDIAAKKANLGGIKSIQERLGSFDRVLGQVSRGELPETAFMLQKLGINAKTASQDTNASFIKIVNAYNSLKDPAEKAVLLQRLFADRTGKLGLTFQEIGPDIEKFNELLRKEGLLLTKDGAEAALAFDRSLSILGERISAVATQFSRPLVRPFSEALNALVVDLGEGANAASFFGDMLASKIKEVTDTLVMFVAFLKVFADNGVWKALTLGPKEFDKQWGQNVINIKKGNTEIKQSDEDLQLQLDESLKREQERSRIRLATLDLEREKRKSIEKQITDDLKREVDLRIISRKQADKKEIDEINKTYIRENLILVGKLNEILTRPIVTDNDRKQQRLDIEKLYEEMAQLAKDADSKKKDIQTQSIVHDREQLEQAADERIALQRATADNEIAILEAKAAKNATIQEQTLGQIKVYNDQVAQLELAELKRRRDAAGADSELRRQLQSQVDIKLLQIQGDAFKVRNAKEEANYQNYRTRLQNKYSRMAQDEEAGQARITEIMDAAARRDIVIRDRFDTMAADQAVRATEARIDQLRGLADVAKSLGDTGTLNDVANQITALFATLGTQVQTLAKLRAASTDDPITLSEAEAEKTKILVDALNKRIQAKKDEIESDRLAGRDVEALNTELRGIEQARVFIIQDGARAARDARIQEREQTRSIMTETNSIIRAARQQQIETELNRIQRTASFISTSMQTRIDQVRIETALNVENARINNAAALEENTTKKRALRDSNLSLEEYIRRLKALNEEREAEVQRSADEVAQIILNGRLKEKEVWKANDPFEQGLQGADPFERFRKAAEENAAATGRATIRTSDSVKLMKGIAGQAIGQFAQGVGSLVEQWVLMGTVGPNAMRKMTASILAGLAKQAATEAIMELARGFANLAKAAAAAPTNPAAAIAYAAAADANFTSAAIFGAVAGIAAVSGRAIAGNAFAEQSATKTATDAKAKDDEIKHTDEGRRQFVEHIHRVVVTGEKGFVARQFVDEVKNNNQEVRRAVNTATK